MEEQVIDVVDVEEIKEEKKVKFKRLKKVKEFYNSHPEAILQTASIAVSLMSVAVGVGKLIVMHNQETTMRFSFTVDVPKSEIGNLIKDGKIDDINNWVEIGNQS